MALAFEPHELYEPSAIELSFMPPYHEQQPYLEDFQLRVQRLLIQAAQESRSLSGKRAETIIWQELEEALLNLALSQNISHTKRK